MQEMRFGRLLISFTKEDYWIYEKGSCGCRILWLWKLCFVFSDKKCKCQLCKQYDCACSCPLCEKEYIHCACEKFK